MTVTSRAPTGRRGRILRRLIAAHVRPHWRKLLLASFCLIVTAAATAANAWLMKPALDHVLLDRDAMLFWLVPAAIVAVSLAKAGAAFWESVLVNEAGQNIVSDLQVGIFRRLMAADLAWLHQEHSGKLISTLVYDATLLRETVGRGISALARDALTLIFLMAVMLSQNWHLALVGMVAFPAVALYTRKLGNRSRKRATASQVETGKLTAILSETFDSVRTVKAYGMEAFETERTAQAVARRMRELVRGARARAAASPMAEAMGGCAIAVAILYGGWLANNDVITPGEFFSFLAALLFAYRPLKALSTLYPVVQEGLSAAERLFAILDIEPAVRDRPGAGALVVNGGGIRFENVGFRYADGTTALSEVSFSVPAGRHIALVGPSGAGKSTILNLILRFYDPSQGAISIDGQDLREVSLESLRRSIAFVAQETSLFDTTIRANIAYGRRGASQAEIEAAARAAAAHDFILKLPRGYETRVGENGVRLSGGQRQRIAIARAMLRDAPILLLDEATSSLDSDAEQKVQAAMRRLMTGRTALIVAHRLSTVIDADRIFVIDGGRIVESGRHEELLARGGAYARLFATQFANASRRPSPGRRWAGTR
ncbi:MAG: ABC transporter ATP-binding protein [Alphaproteobacteria bacterium]|nr:ABC transporter ATP-binding protein [Alphaproteobacteria bacterium]